MRARDKGFSLIELMVVVVIIGILAGVAYPSYIEYSKRTQRAAIASLLSEQVQILERYYSRNNAYTVTASPPTISAGNNYYTIGSTLNAQDFTLTATGKGLMANDKCGVFTITNTGARTNTGASSGVTPKDCWSR